MKDDLSASLEACGQEHLLAFWEELDEHQRELLAAQIREIDFALIDRLYRSGGTAEDASQLAERAESPPAFRLDTSGNRFTPEEARRRGTEALSAGEVGVILVAGGQGTRLGFDRPKGMFPIGPVSDCSLLRIHIEKILATSERCGTRIPLYLMTSPATHRETAEFLGEHDGFQLPQRDLHVFCQGTMPAVDADTGKVLLARPDSIALSPDGHGGTVAALAASGCLEDIRRRGIRHLFYLQVDNPLVEICSPEFIGYHLLSGSEFSTQVVAKHEPLEKVGNVVSIDGRLHVIEYSDLPKEAARRCNPDGSLAIWAGSIAVHVMETALLERLSVQADSLPFHIASKRVSCVDPGGTTVHPEEPNAVKFERFIFDMMPSAAGAIVMEVDPARNFGPLKNAPGEPADTPESVKAQMVAEHARWLRQAGVEVDDDVAVEISPCFALDAVELAEKIQPGTRVTEPTYFC